MRFALAAIAIVVLAGCTATVNGVGRLEPTRSGAGGSTSQTGSADIRRIGDGYWFGDAVTADYCARIPVSAFRRWGAPFRHWYQSAGRCYVDVFISRRASFQLDTSLNGYFDASGSHMRRIRGGYIEFSFPPVDGQCERGLQLPDSDVVFETHAIADGQVADRTLCGAAEKWVSLEMKGYPTGRAPRRSLASPSLTRLDLCKLITAANVASLAGLDSLDLTNPDLGDSCVGTGSRYSIHVQIAFISGRLPPQVSRSVVAGHELQRYALPQHGCEILSRQGLTRDRNSYEELDVTVTPDTSTAPRSLCPLATNATVAMLQVANLR